VRGHNGVEGREPKGFRHIFDVISVKIDRPTALGWFKPKALFEVQFIEHGNNLERCARRAKVGECDDVNEGDTRRRVQLWFNRRVCTPKTYLCLFSFYVRCCLSTLKFRWQNVRSTWICVLAVRFLMPSQQSAAKAAKYFF
jgi:hypothetical protein